MKKILISDGKLEVANVCLGAMNFGTTTDKKSAYEVLDAYIERGGNFIDTSNNYAHWAGTGDESETLLGEWLRDRKCRDKVIIATAFAPTGTLSPWICPVVWATTSTRKPICAYCLTIRSIFNGMGFNTNSGAPMT